MFKSEQDALDFHSEDALTLLDFNWHYELLYRPELEQLINKAASDPPKFKNLRIS